MARKIDWMHPELPRPKPRPPRPVAPHDPVNKLVFAPDGRCLGFAALPPTPPASIVEAELID
jgi:hypothetical protein